ncbi:hypothetical protein AYI70_g9503 [Smittium culicis]|uniref:Nicotinamide riboside kinase n=1 Tax=Smittium culicis TaxID=133412 RepID=A0A1R1XAW4_9FUNG|nr:hypothetical protein AYI70_g9503 [Smittium culicis]
MPIDHSTGLPIWDSPDCFDYGRLIDTITNIKLSYSATKTIPKSNHSALSHWSLPSTLPSTSTSTSAPNTSPNTTDSAALALSLALALPPSTLLIIVEGILLYNCQALLPLFDVRIFLLASKLLCKTRRSARNTQLSTTPLDPLQQPELVDQPIFHESPLYFDAIVWPNYLRFSPFAPHNHLLPLYPIATIDVDSISHHQLINSASSIIIAHLQSLPLPQ